MKADDFTKRDEEIIALSTCWWICGGKTLWNRHLPWASSAYVCVPPVLDLYPSITKVSWFYWYLLVPQIFWCNPYRLICAWGPLDSRTSVHSHTAFSLTQRWTLWKFPGQSPTILVLLVGLVIIHGLRIPGAVIRLHYFAVGLPLFARLAADPLWAEGL